MPHEDSSNDRLSSPQTGCIAPEVLFEQIDKSGVLFLCAEPGMGRTTLLVRLSALAAGQGRKTRFEDHAGMSVKESLNCLGSTLRWSRGKRVRSSGALVVIDNMPAGDEADVDAQVSVIRGIVALGCLVAVSLLPEAQMLVEMLGEARCYWSCDLTFPVPETACERAYYNAYTHGIAALVDGLQKTYDPNFDTLLSDPCYQKAFVGMVDAALRDGIMREELTLRATLLLFGRGTRADVQRVLGAIDDDIWRSLARDAPLFGINVSRDAFSCVGASCADAVHAAFGLLRNRIPSSGEIVSTIVATLIERGDVSRAGVVSLMEDDSRRRCALGLKWGLRFLEAGEVGVVSEAVLETREHSYLGLEGFWDSASALWALGIEEGEVDEEDVYACARRGDLSPCATSIVDARERLRRRGLPEPTLPTGADTLCEGIATWGRAIDHIAEMRVDKAYELLVNEPQRLQTGVVGSLLAAVYLMCGFTMGALPTDADLEAWDKDKAFLERCGLGSVLGLEDSLLRAGAMLGGRWEPDVSFEAAMRRASHAGDDVLYSAFLLLSGVCDMRSGALTRSHVRLESAHTAFARLNMEAPEKVAKLLDAAVRFQLGETVRKADLTACRGAGVAFDRVVSLLFVALFPTKRGVPARSLGRVYPNEVHWLINILCFDCRDLSRRVLDVLPQTWLPVVRRRTQAVDLQCERAAPPHAVTDANHEAQAEPERECPLVKVQLLGGFEVLVRGEPIDLTRLERRGARVLLAFLVAVPGHAAKRFMLMESLWPNHDYNAAVRCVYAATSVLRGELASAVGGPEASKLVLTSKAEGTVSLDASIACDVDEFEDIAHSALDHEGSNRELVELARSAEELYRGDLVVPPCDGMGVLETRAHELRSLFADVMVAGAQAAAELGLKMLACRFAGKAHEADAMREDAVRTLVSALCAAGRHVEAQHTFEGYVGYLAEHTSMPPSKKLRDDVRVQLETSRRQRNVRIDPRQLELGFGQQGA